MSEERKHESSRRSVVYVVVALVVALLIFFVYTAYQSSDNNQQNSGQTSVNKTDNVDSAIKEQEIASANVVSASLDLYYAVNRNYPVNINQLKEFLSQQTDGADNVASLESSVNKLQSFDYTKRGDSQAYTFTYYDQSGEKVTKEGNYSEEYH